MDIALSDSQRLLSDTIRSYLEDKVPFARVRQVEATDDFDRDLWAYLAESEFLALPFSTEMGGQDGNLEDTAVIIEALTRRAAVVPFMETVASALAVVQCGDNVVAKEMAGAIMGGTMTIVPSMVDERSTRATVVAGRLEGRKEHVDFGHTVSHHLVEAEQDGTLGLFLVDAHDANVAVRPQRTIARTPRANVEYSGAAATQVTGLEGGVFLRLLARSLAAVQCTANAEEALAMTVDYVGGRVQFGRPIGSFQAVQHHCANMATMVEAARFLVFEAVWKVGRGLASEVEVATAKAWASKVASEVPMMAHQLHGGIGVTEEYDLHFFSRHGKERSLAWGTAEECLRMVAAGYRN